MRMRVSTRTLFLAALLLAAVLAGPVLLAGTVTPSFEFSIPVASLTIQGVTPLQPGTYSASIANCRVRCTNTRRIWCYVFAAPYPLEAEFTDPVEGVSFPITQLAIRNTSTGSYLGFDNLTPKQFHQVYIFQRNTWYNFTCNFRLTMTGNEAAGNYSVMIQLTASQSP